MGNIFDQIGEWSVLHTEITDLIFLKALQLNYQYHLHFLTEMLAVIT